MRNDNSKYQPPTKEMPTTIDLEMHFNRIPNAPDLSAIHNRRMVVIDGDQGSGKSYLAKELAKSLVATVVSVDDYLSGNGNPYLSQIDWKSLKSMVLENEARNLILEGVLLEQVLQILQVEPSYRIFMRLKTDGVWDYKQYLDESRAVAPRAKLTSEIAIYYREMRPWEGANEELCLLQTPTTARSRNQSSNNRRTGL